MASKLRGKKLLMVHGTADDNVHYQQSMMMTRALEEADVLFQQLREGGDYLSNTGCGISSATLGV
jgi:fermentation-respiration switch protein FrsA (DUF1100 family)